MHSLLALNPGGAPEGGPQHPSLARFLACGSVTVKRRRREEGHRSACGEVFLAFAICPVSKMSFQPQGRQISVSSANHCVRALQAVMIHAGCFIEQHRQGADSGAFHFGCAG